MAVTALALMGAWLLASDAVAQSSPLPVAPGASFRDAPWAPEMVVIPPGRFVMGAGAAETTREGKPEAHAAWERPQHEVTVAAPFAIGKFDVTRAEFKRFLAATHRATDGG